MAAVKALSGPQDCVKKTVEVYRRRRDVLVEGLNSIGWKVPKPKATFYIWAHIPDKFSALTSMEFASLMVNEAGVVTAPGTGFGEYGEGYVRFALVEDEDKIPFMSFALKRFCRSTGIFKPWRAINVRRKASIRMGETSCAGEPEYQSWLKSPVIRS